jgi:hypothetical protein
MAFLPKDVYDRAEEGYYSAKSGDFSAKRWINLHPVEKMRVARSLCLVLRT